MKSTTCHIRVFFQCLPGLMGSRIQWTESSGWAGLELISASSALYHRSMVEPAPSICYGLWFHCLPSHRSPFLSLYPTPSFPPQHFTPQHILSSSGTFSPSLIPISLPFVIISQLIFALSRSQEQVVLTHQGVGPLTFQRPLQTCNAPFALHCSLFLPALPFSAVDERHQLEETERNGPNYSIGNWKLAN